MCLIRIVVCLCPLHASQHATKVLIRVYVNKTLAGTSMKFTFQRESHKTAL